ncbi:unnamed protein product [Gadus morhua 'NCC']
MGKSLGDQGATAPKFYPAAGRTETHGTILSEPTIATNRPPAPSLHHKAVMVTTCCDFLMSVSFFVEWMATTLKPGGPPRETCRPCTAPTVSDVNRLFCVGLRGLNNPDIVATDVDLPPPRPTHTNHHTGKCPLLTVEAAWKNCSNSDGNYRTSTLLNTNCCRPTTNRGGPTRLKISWSMRQTAGPGRHLLQILHCPQESTDNLKHVRKIQDGNLWKEERVLFLLNP